MSSAGTLASEPASAGTFGRVSLVEDRPDATHLVVEAADPSLGGLDLSGSQEADAAFTARPGWPELPMITRLVLVPPTGGVTLRVNEIQSRVESGVQIPLAPRPDDVLSETQPAPEFLQYQGFWPPEAVVVGEPAVLRGYRLVQVTVYPVQYNPSTRQVRFNDRVNFELVYGGPGVNEVADPDRRRPSSSLQTVLESLVVNPPPRRDSPEGPERGSYMIIYPNVNGVLNALQPLIDWRAREGWEVHAVEVQNGAQAANVKNLIQAAYDEWSNPPEMVALVGDADGNGNAFYINAWPANAGGMTDLDYVLLEGNDILADADVGRISVESVAQLQAVVAKLVNYEVDPYMQNTDWFRAGMVCAGASVSGLSTILVNRWVARELAERGANSVHEWYFNAPYGGLSVPQFFESEFRRGVAFCNYRGWIGIEGTTPATVMGYAAHRQYPIAIVLTCGSGNYVNTLGMNEAMLRGAGAGIGGVGLYTSSTHVQYNNAISVGVWHGLLKKNLLRFGSIINYGRYELYRQYRGFADASVVDFSKWTAFMGDPATHILTTVPRRLTAAHPQTLPLGASRLVVEVEDAATHQAAPGVVVCLYKRNDSFQMVRYTDREGAAEFDFAPDDLSQGDLWVTVTDDNAVPYRASVPVRQNALFLGASGYEVTSDDDANGVPNPGETLELDLALVNFGEASPEDAATVTARSASPWAQVTSEPVEIGAEDLPEPGAAVSVPVTVELNPAVPDRQTVPVEVEVQCGEIVWTSSVVLIPESPRVAISRLIFDRQFLPGEIVELDVEIRNGGRRRLQPFTARMWSEHPVVTFPRGQARFNAVNPGQTVRVDGDRFRIRAHPLTIPGMSVTLKLAVEDERGFRDTTDWVVTIGQPQRADPLGPDRYGYGCFDSGDRDWELAPTYEWIEIDPNVQGYRFRGTDTQLSDVSEDNDRSVVVNLPFEFQYYGRRFNQLTICTNGWAAFGNWGQLADFRNRRIASGGGPNAQLCVFWDNLTTGRILYHYDRDGGRFIVEWNNMHRQWGGENRALTFQLILYESWAEPTYTGDGVIVYQYKSIQNAAGSDVQNNDTPYATVGISNLDDTDGLEYTYWNTYPPAAKPLEDQMALKFTTATHFIVGALAGRVTDAATGGPIAGAQITTARGFWGETDQNGEYLINDILIGENYWVKAEAQGYNDSTLAGEDGRGYTIAEGETTRVDFALLHPEFNLSTMGLDFRLAPDSSSQTAIHLSNDGNGPLDFFSRYIYVVERDGKALRPSRGLRALTRDEPDEQWDNLLTWNAESPTGAPRIQGIAFARDHWIVAGASVRDSVYFYAFDRAGHYTGRFPQPPYSSYGIRDMEYVRGELVCATDAGLVAWVDPETGAEIRRASTSPRLRRTAALTVKPDGHLLVAGITGPIVEYEVIDDSTLFEVASYDPRDPRAEAPNNAIYKTGLAWFRDDPDGFHLYIYGYVNLQLSTPQLFKMNLETGEVRFLTDLGLSAAEFSARGGISITPKWNNLVWVVAVTVDHPMGDRISVFEIAPNSSWIDYRPRSGHLDAGEALDFEVEITTADLDTGAYGVTIQFIHNADDGEALVPIRLVVAEPDTTGLEQAITTPAEYALYPNVPNPFNPVTAIAYSLRQPGWTTLKVFDLAGREVAVLAQGWQEAGRHRVSWEAAGLPAGLYLCRLESGRFRAVRKMVLVK